MYNHERMLVRLLRTIAHEKGIDCVALEQDWILYFSWQGKQARVFGYQFDLNPSAGMLMASDKSATYHLLHTLSLGAVEHHVFLHPKKATYIARDGNWHSMLNYLALHGEVVCKPNTGTGGQDVYKVDSAASLEQAVHSIFMAGQDVALSPYLPIDAEHRLIMLDGECVLCYQKIRPEIVADGVHTLQELVKSRGIDPSLCSPLVSWDAIPLQGEHVALEWRHNLAKGAKAGVVTASTAHIDLAIHAVKALGLRFCAVDIVTIAGKLYVLEVNSGVMMEHYARQGLAEFEHAKHIYARALYAMLGG